jgi:hypothetical protein
MKLFSNVGRVLASTVLGGAIVVGAAARAGAEEPAGLDQGMTTEQNDGHAGVIICVPDQANPGVVTCAIPTETTVATAPSPELTAAQKRLDQLRASGGWAYKTGSIQRAAAELPHLGGDPGPNTGTYEEPR